MIEENVKQTRCTTCDAEHPYKGGQAPRRRRKETPAALYKEVLAGRPDTDSAATQPLLTSDSEPASLTDADDAEPTAPPAAIAAAPSDAARVVESPARLAEPATLVRAPEVAPPLEARVSEIEVRVAEIEARLPDVEEGPVHRPLIRATLPRPEGQKDVRVPPDFTIRQAGGRNGNGNGNGNHAGNTSFRGNNNGRSKPRGAGAPGGNGHRPHGGGPRFAGARPGQGQGGGRGQGGGFRSAQPQPRSSGGRKRSR